jgi:hypothetical protein
VRTHAKPPRGRNCARTARRHRPELRHGGRELFQRPRGKKPRL